MSDVINSYIKSKVNGKNLEALKALADEIGVTCNSFKEIFLIERSNEFLTKMLDSDIQNFAVGITYYSISLESSDKEKFKVEKLSYYGTFGEALSCFGIEPLYIVEADQHFKNDNDGNPCYNLNIYKINEGLMKTYNWRKDRKQLIAMRLRK